MPVAYSEAISYNAFDLGVYLQGALVMPLMSNGYKMGLIKFVLITAEKPE